MSARVSTKVFTEMWTSQLQRVMSRVRSKAMSCVMTTPLVTINTKIVKKDMSGSLNRVVPSAVTRVLARGARTNTIFGGEADRT